MSSTATVAKKERIVIGVQWKRREASVALNDKNLPIEEEEPVEEEQLESKEEARRVVEETVEETVEEDDEDDEEEEVAVEEEGSTSSASQDDSTINITLQSPTNRYLHTSTLINNDNQILIFGGYTLSNIMNDTYIYTIDKDEWQEITTSSNPPSVRYGHAATVCNNKVYVFGGKNTDSYLNDLHEFDPETLQWTEVKIRSEDGKQLLGRAHHTLCTFNNHLYVFGGSDDETIFIELIEINLNAKTWKQLSAIENYDGPPARDQHTAVVNNNLMYVFGGVSEDILSDFWQLDLPTKKWSKVKETAILGLLRPSQRSGHVSGICGENLIILGGEDPDSFTYHDNIYAFHLPTSEWIQVKQMANFAPSAHAKASFTKDKIYLFGGYNNQIGPLDDFFIGTVKPVKRRPN